LTRIYNKEITNKLLEVHNYYFDITPDNITDIISDLGVLSTQKFVEKVKQSVPIEWFKYFLKDNG